MSALPVGTRPRGRVARAGFAVHISGFQIYMSTILMSLVYGGVLGRHPRMRVVIGEGRIGWIPYILDHRDLDWEDQFGDLGLSMRPSEYWRRQCRATYQSNRIGIKLLDELGEDNVMWGSDFPHLDGVWPDSSEVIARELGHLPVPARGRLLSWTCDARLLWGESRSTEPAAECHGASDRNRRSWERANAT